MTTAAEAYAFTATVSSTEYSLTNNSTSLATRATVAVVQLFVDTANMTATEEYEVAMLEKVITGGTQRRIVLASLIGAQADPFVTGSFVVGVGWDFSLKKIAGTDRAFSWSVRTIT